MLTRQLRRLVLAAVLLATALPGRAAETPVSLMEAGQPALGWEFGNGPEFPGATGSLAVDPAVQRDGRPSLKLVADFSKGGGYVQAGRKIDGVDVRELSFWVRGLDVEQITLRVTDSSEQCHQIRLATEKEPGWQRVVLPLERFFTRRGQPDAVTTVRQYQYWGGAKDGQWHGPATGFYLLLSNGGRNDVRSVWLSDVSIVPRPAPVPGVEVPVVLPLDEIIEGEHDWKLNLGWEFKGAKGTLTPVQGQPEPGRQCLKLAADFTGGGAYIAALRDLKELGAKDVTAFRMRAKLENGGFIGVQLVDGTGQCHQQKRLPLPADGQWHDFEIRPAQIAGGEHWGGANDGKWHGAPSLLSITLKCEPDAKEKTPALSLADVRAEAVLAVFRQPAAFRCGFEESPRLPADWAAQGAISVDTKAAAKGANSLLLSRSPEAVNRPCSAAGPTFEAAPGLWEVGAACRPDLRSPDNSYSGVVSLECLDAAGKALERVAVADVFGRGDWRAASRRVEMPKGTASARFQVQINKAEGRLWVDELSAAYLAPSARKDDRIARVLFSTAQLGNLLFPNDPRRVDVTVEAKKPLRDSQRSLACVVRDYWGAEQTRPMTVTLDPPQKEKERYVYKGTVDLAQAPLEAGRYYEVHVSLPQPGDEPYTDYTSLAILPEAQARRYKPEEIPFTSRNWDNRIGEFIRLTDRLGVRICGIWGSWSAEPPYKPQAPQIDLCRQLGMGVLTTTPCHSIELGKKEYTEEALRQGVRNFLEEYGKTRPLIINLGNEPHGTGAQVLANVAAYRAVYEEVKKVDPTIPVVATSVEPNEEYFRAGYGQWCDAYDFHIYEGYPNVRKTIQQYQALMKQYGVVKPIWSTELGLNSQGMTRHAVAVELVKKFATFFAAGGTSASWFGLLYPDPEGKLYGTSGDAHNVFNCRYKCYSPRLDAVAYYHAVNAIAIKKFVQEKQYPDGVNAFLFADRDGRRLQILWKEKGRRDVLLPLPGVRDVRLIGIDGRQAALNAGGKGVTVSVSPDPILLLYQGGASTLPAALGAPAAEVAAVPQQLRPGGTTELAVAAHGAPAGGIQLSAPPFWSVGKGVPGKDSSGKPVVRFTVTAPKATAVREAGFAVRLAGGQGELAIRVPMAAEE